MNTRLGTGRVFRAGGGRDDRDRGNAPLTGGDNGMIGGRAGIAPAAG